MWSFFFVSFSIYFYFERKTKSPQWAHYSQITNSEKSHSGALFFQFVILFILFIFLLSFQLQEYSCRFWTFITLLVDSWFHHYLCLIFSSSCSTLHILSPPAIHFFLIIAIRHVWTNQKQDRWDLWSANTTKHPSFQRWLFAFQINHSSKSAKNYWWGNRWGHKEETC